MPRFGKDTGELLHEIREAQGPSDVLCYLEGNAGEFVRPLHEYLSQLLEERHLEKSAVIRASRLERTYAYHIFSGSRPHPSRPKLLALALAMGLDLPETQYLLRYAGHGPLYPRNPWDAVVIAAIEQGLPVEQANELLAQLGARQALE